MAFTWINNQGVRSDQGFEVQTVSQNTIEYRECGRKITVYFEIGISGSTPCFLIESDCFRRWDNMPQSSTLNNDEQKRIEGNFRAAMKFQGVKVSP